MTLKKVIAVAIAVLGVEFASAQNLPLSDQEIDSRVAQWTERLTVSIHRISEPTLTATPTRWSSKSVRFVEPVAAAELEQKAVAGLKELLPKIVTVPSYYGLFVSFDDGEEKRVRLKTLYMFFKYENKIVPEDVYKLSTYTRLLGYTALYEPQVVDVGFIEKDSTGAITHEFWSKNGAYPLGCFDDLLGNGVLYIETSHLRRFQEDIRTARGTGEIIFAHNAERTLYRKYDQFGRFLASNVPIPPRLEISQSEGVIQLKVIGVVAFDTGMLEESSDLTKGWTSPIRASGLRKLSDEPVYSIVPDGVVRFYRLRENTQQ